jgi:hypothetical protein
MTVEIGAEAALFPEKEDINGIFVAVWGKPISGCWGIATLVVFARSCRIRGKRISFIHLAPRGGHARGLVSGSCCRANI